MADTKTTIASATLLLAAFAAGAGADRLANPSPSTSAKPALMRWLNEGKDKDGKDKPSSYAIGIVTQIGANQGVREIVCDADGGSPRLNGAKMSSTKADDLCAAAAKFGKQASDAVGAMAGDLVK